MLPIEGAGACSKADVLAIDALFRRIAERGRRIRTQKQYIPLPTFEKARDGRVMAPEQMRADKNGQTS
jgi:hypothetical protein